MTFADALNLLANLRVYADYGMTEPHFVDLDENRVAVEFTVPHLGRHRFNETREISAYIAGYTANTAMQARRKQQGEDGD